MNGTIPLLHHHHHHHALVKAPPAIDVLPSGIEDPFGAAVFIVIVLLWYSMCLACMLGTQIRARSETIDDCARRRAKIFIETLQDQTERKQILEELVDKDKRDRLWKIYRGDKKVDSDQMQRAEKHRITNIRKQLAVIDRNRLIMNETWTLPLIHPALRASASDSQSTILSNLSAIEIPTRTRRRPSLDQQIIEQWKLLVDQSKSHEHMPWPIRKLLIRRHFRRYCTSTSDDRQAPVIGVSMNEDQEHLLPLPHDCRHETHQRLNPYVTYFHLPLADQAQSRVDHIPLAKSKSDHHIVQMDRSVARC